MEPLFFGAIFSIIFDRILNKPINDRIHSPRSNVIGNLIEHARGNHAETERGGDLRPQVELVLDPCLCPLFVKSRLARKRPVRLGRIPPGFGLHPGVIINGLHDQHPILLIKDRVDIAIDFDVVDAQFDRMVHHPKFIRFEG